MPCTLISTRRSTTPPIRARRAPTAKKPRTRLLGADGQHAAPPHARTGLRRRVRRRRPPRRRAGREHALGHGAERLRAAAVARSARRRRDADAHRSRAGRPPNGAATTCGACCRIPVALAQCAEFFRANRSIQAVPVFDTAGAVEIVMREDDGLTAAIAARRAADALHGAVLAEHLQDHPENWTRFLLLARPAAHRRGRRREQDAGRLRSAARARRAGACAAAAGRARGQPHQDREPADAGNPFEYRFVVELTGRERRGETDAMRSDEMRNATPWLSRSWARIAA